MHPLPSDDPHFSDALFGALAEREIPLRPTAELDAIAASITGPLQAVPSARRRSSLRTSTVPSSSVPPRARWALRALAGAGLLGACVAGVVMTSRGRTGEYADPASHVSDAGAMKEVRTRPAQVASVTLPDGSKVTLAPGSRLRYPADFDASSRTVTLDGEAVFTIARSSGHPFIVSAGASTTRVLGTTFGVTTVGGIRVAVAEGKVALAASHAATPTVLTPGDVARTDARGLTTVSRGADVVSLLAWTTGRLEFHDAPARDVADRLEQWYGVQIIVPPSVQAQRVTLALDNNPSSDAAVRVFAALVRCQIVQRGGTITLVD